MHAVFRLFACVYIRLIYVYLSTCALWLMLMKLTPIFFTVYDWSKDDVSTWLKQLSPALHELYQPCFTKHDVTGKFTCIHKNPFTFTLYSCLVP